MKELVEVIVKALVDDPEAVQVEEEIIDRHVNLELSVAEDDMGKVIGKRGRIAKSIRTVLKAAGIKEDKQVNLDIVD